MTTEAAWLLVALMIAHYLGDFTILASARLHETKTTGGPLSIIGGHAGIHGLLMAPILIAFSGAAEPSLLAAAGIVLSHFVIDATRARLTLRFAGLADPTRKLFWSALGFDQLLHGLVLVWATLSVL
ncbi:MAG: DUF3307 domain-containing protein [Gemmatimonadota bacterium]